MQNTINVLDHEIQLLYEYLNYNPDTGLLVWKKRPNNSTKVGDIAGNIRKDGYVRLVLKGKPYYAHRVAYVLVMGKWPERLLDHINTVRSDNRWSNLREATPSQQAHNRKVPSTNSTGVKGVIKSGEKYRVQINIKGKTHVRICVTLDEAKTCASQLRQQLHGEFANNG